MATAELTHPGSTGAFPWIYSAGQMCYSNPVSAGSGNKIIPVSTGAGGAQLHPWIPAPPGWDSWKRLGKACQSQSPDGIFVLPGNRAEGKGQSVAGDTGGQWCVLLTWPSASGFGIRNHPPWLPSFSSSFPGTGTAALPPRALSSAGQTPECPGSFLQLFIFEEAGKKKRFPSFFLGWATSVLPWSSVSPPAQAQPRDRRQDPPPPFRTLGLGLARDSSLSRRQDFPHSTVSARKWS